MKPLPLLLVALCLACTKADTAADSADAAVPAVDTLRAAPGDSLAGVGTSTGATTGATSGTKVTPPTSSTTKAGSTRPAADTNLGRDRAIQIDTKNPRNRLPVVDSTKRPPQG